MRSLLLSALTLSISACGVPSQSYELQGGGNALKVVVSEGPKPTSGPSVLRGSGLMVVHVDTTQAAFAAQANITKFMKRTASGNVAAEKLGTAAGVRAEPCMIDNQ